MSKRQLDGKNNLFYTSLVIKTIVITGTHHTPAIELINQLKKDKRIQWQIAYIGREHLSSISALPPIEKKLIPEMGISYYPLNCGKLDRRWLPNTLRGIPQTILAIIKSYRLLGQLKPDIIVSFGGYVSTPVIIASWLRAIPSITHEQTLTVSFSTKLNSFFATKVALSFDQSYQKSSLPQSKIIITGNLIRSDIYKNTSPLFVHRFARRRPLLYFTGGNQGSTMLNQTVLAALPELSKKFNVIHQTGTSDYQLMTKKTHQYSSCYHPVEFVGLNDIGWVLQHSQIVISRSGANSAQEIDLLSKKVIFVPLPFSQQNEQLLNAQWVLSRHPQTTIIIEQSGLTVKKLLLSIDELLNKPTPEAILNPNPSAKFMDSIYELV